MSEELTERKRVSVAQLKTGRIWTNWIWHTKNGKQTKRPISKVNDPNTWLSYEQALSNTEWSEQGIGIMFAKIVPDLPSVALTLTLIMLTPIRLQKKFWICSETRTLRSLPLVKAITYCSLQNWINFQLLKSTRNSISRKIQPLMWSVISAE